MFNSSHSSLPNPFTPLAFLPPDVACQLTVAIYVLVASLAVLIWDFISNLRADVRLLTLYPLTTPTIVYFVSRVSSLAYLLTFTIILTAPVGHCDNLPRVAVLYVIAIPSTSLLLLFRVCSLYAWDTFVVAFFSFLWLAVVGGSITPILGVSASNIGTTNYCISSGLKPYVSLSFIAIFVYDTLVFCATGWRLLGLSDVNPSDTNGIKVMGFGRHLPAFSRAVLKDGQSYYLTIVTLNLVTTSLFFNHSIPLVYRSFIGVPNIVLMNAMACHVYRQVKFGVYRDFPACESHPLSGNGARVSMNSIVFARMPRATDTSMSTSTAERTFIDLPGLGRASVVDAETMV